MTLGRSRKYFGVTLAALVGWMGCARATKLPESPPKPPEVTISKVVERDVIDYEEFTGRIDAVADVEVRARVRGYLNAVRFADGQEVKTGDLLFEIDPRTFEAELKNAEGQKAQWLAKRDKAQADVARYEHLVPPARPAPRTLTGRAPNWAKPSRPSSRRTPRSTAPNWTWSSRGSRRRSMDKWDERWSRREIWSNRGRAKTRC